MNDWNYTGDWNYQWRETDDPRILEVIALDEGAQGPDGDVFAPAYWLEYRGEWRHMRAGATFDDEAAADALVTAWGYWGQDNDTARRYLRIFHGIEYVLEWLQGDVVAILDTPAHREHIGSDAQRDLTAYPTDEWLRGDRETWRAYLDGDVWGIGYAVLEGRVTTETPVVFEDFEVTIEVWGYYGEDCAKGSLEDIEWPELDPMLPLV